MSKKAALDFTLKCDRIFSKDNFFGIIVNGSFVPEHTTNVVCCHMVSLNCANIQACNTFKKSIVTSSLALIF